jgi:hypothetical protein
MFILIFHNLAAGEDVCMRDGGEVMMEERRMVGANRGRRLLERTREAGGSSERRREAGGSSEWMEE